MSALFYPLDEPYVEKTPPTKKVFVACRMEVDLFQQLSLKAQREGSDLSTVIRDLCREGLKK